MYVNLVVVLKSRLLYVCTHNMCKIPFVVKVGKAFGCLGCVGRESCFTAHITISHKASQQQMIVLIRLVAKQKMSKVETPVVCCARLIISLFCISFVNVKYCVSAKITTTCPLAGLNSNTLMSLVPLVFLYIDYAYLTKHE